MRIVASAPTRLDFGGGWTDVPPYPEERGGFVCNIAIERRATVVLQPSPDAHATRSSAELPPPLVEAALRRAGLSGAAVTLTSDFPLGAGLGGSSAAGVALAAALLRASGANEPDPEGCVKLSRAVEVDELGIAGGWQDHYAAAYGGALALTFGAETVVERIPLAPSAAARLERRCLLAYTGESRISATTITAVLDAYSTRDARVVHALDRMATLARMMRDALGAADIDMLAALVDEHWAYQRTLHPGITTERIDALEQAARGAGAIGLKALGASGGGSVIVFTPEHDSRAVARAITPFASLLPWRVATEGVMISED